MTEEKVRAFFTVANFDIIRLDRIENKYWPDNEAYQQVRSLNPWWLVETPEGVIEIGNRKRVTSISWDRTPLKMEITKDDVTKDLTLVHAWSTEKIVEYLCSLKKHLYELHTRYVLEDRRGNALTRSSFLELIDLTGDKVFFSSNRAPKIGEIVRVSDVALPPITEIIEKSERVIKFTTDGINSFYLIDKLNEFK